MNHQDLEKQIRMLRPAPLPDDLKRRLAASEPIVEAKPRRTVSVWAMAASIAAAAILAWVLVPADSDRNKTIADDADDGHLSIMKQESTLLGSRTLETREHNGRVWELVENKWREDTIGMCSATHATVRSSEIRPELVWVPVEFY